MSTETPGVWIAMTVKPLKERLAQNWLTMAGITHTLPMAIKLVRRSRHQKGKPKPVKVPAMRGYVFLFVPKGDTITDLVNRARKCTVVQNPVAVRGVPLVMLDRARPEDGLNDNLMNPFDAYEPPAMVIGEMARVRPGYSFAGFKGRVDNIRGDEVQLMIEGLRLALLTVPARAIEKIAA